jgi:drug/metabolite transporter (DMT)-like permease
MSIEVFFAVLFAAALHAGWNALVKINAEPIIAMGLMMTSITIVALAFIPFIPFPPAQMWPWLLVSLVLHFGYNVFLVNAYAQGDFGQVYPIARGSAPVWALLVSLVFLGAEFTWGQIIAVLLIAGGLQLRLFALVWC